MKHEKIKWFEIDILNQYRTIFPAKQKPTPAEALQYLAQNDNFVDPPDWLLHRSVDDIREFYEISEAEKDDLIGGQNWPPFE